VEVDSLVDKLIHVLFEQSVRITDFLKGKNNLFPGGEKAA
jgi:hypothetical protein